MGKKILCVYLAKNDTPYSAAYAKLELPASPWELWDAMEKVRLKDGEELYMEIEDYYDFSCLAPHLSGLDITLMELNNLAAHLSELDELQQIGFNGLLQIAVERKRWENAGILTVQDMRDLSVSADCCHVADVTDDAQLGRFYAENDFVPEVNGLPNELFEMLDFAKLGKKMRIEEGGVYTGNDYVVQSRNLRTAPPCQKGLPQKPDYLFRLMLGLHPDIGDDRTVTLILPAAEAELLDTQARLGTLNWENTVVLNYDGILPNAVFFADLPSELEAFNALAKAVRDMPRSEMTKLKALLEQFEVRDIETAMRLTEHLDDYILTPDLSSPQETAIDQLRFMTDEHSVELLIPHVNLYTYGCDVIKEDNAVLSPYGLLHRADYQPLLTPVQQIQEPEMTM